MSKHSINKISNNLTEFFSKLYKRVLKMRRNIPHSLNSSKICIKDNLHILPNVCNAITNRQENKSFRISFSSLKISIRKFTTARYNSVFRGTSNHNFSTKIIYTNAHTAIKNVEPREESSSSSYPNYSMSFCKDFILITSQAPETNSMINVSFLMFSTSTTTLMVINKFPTNSTKILQSIS